MNHTPGHVCVGHACVTLQSVPGLLPLPSQHRASALFPVTESEQISPAESSAVLFSLWSQRAMDWSAWNREPYSCNIFMNL